MPWSRHRCSRTHFDCRISSRETKEPCILCVQYLSRAHAQLPTIVSRGCRRVNLVCSSHSAFTTPAHFHWSWYRPLLAVC